MNTEPRARKRAKTVGGVGFEESKHVNNALPYTCICYKGHFKVTDGEGVFIIPHENNSKKSSLYRCEEDEGRNVTYTYIRSVNNNELDGIENADELNVFKNDTF